MQLADGSHVMVSVVGEDGKGNVVVSFDGGETQVSMRREDVQGMVDAARAQRWELMLDNDEGEKVNSTGEVVSPVEGEGVPSAPNAASHKFELNDVVEVRGEDGKMVQGYVTRPMNEDGLYEVFTDSRVGGLRSAYYAPEDMRLVEAKGVEGLREGAQEGEDGALQGDEGRDERPSLMDAVRTLYEKGKGAAQKLFNMTFFDVARTPDFMKGVGLTGDRFTVRYGVLARHFGKDSAHDLPMEVWEQLPDALQKPFAISEYYTDEDKQQQKGYRIYTRLQLADGSHVMVSAEVKNAGRDVEVNAINTVFGRSVISDVHEKLVYVGNELTPEQQALLNRTTPHQYPDARGQDEEGVPSSEGKDSVSSDNGQGNVGENVTEMPMRRVKRKIEGQVMEVDEEDFEAVSPERTQDYLYNEVESGITREQADDFVSAKIAEREKVVKGIEARKPRKGASPAEIRVHKGKVAAELAEAVPGLEYWRAVAAARDAVKEREIAAANERYRQERAAKEEAKRAAEVQRKEDVMYKQKGSSLTDENLQMPVSDTPVATSDLDASDSKVSTSSEKGKRKAQKKTSNGDKPAFVGLDAFTEQRMAEELEKNGYASLEDWEIEEPDAFVTVYDNVGKEYASYVSRLAEEGTLQEVYDKSSVKAQNKIRKEIEFAGFDYHDLLDTSPNRVKRQDYLEGGAKYARGTFLDGRVVEGEIVEQSPTSITLLANGRRYTIKASDVLMRSNEPLSSDGLLSAKIAAAEGEVDTNPSEGQKEAGNYKKGHIRIGAFDISIEQPKGSVRRGVDANGKAWESKMHNTYGYFRGTEGVDGDHIDVFVSNDIDGWNGQKVFVVDQYNPDGTFDEHKVMLGFNNAEDAKSDYLANYEKGWEDGRRLDVSATSLEDFEKWLAGSHRKTKPFAEYKGVKREVDEVDAALKKELQDFIAQTDTMNRTAMDGCRRAVCTVVA